MSKSIDNGILQDDLRRMLEALGLPSGARPCSPHEVFQTALSEMKRRLAGSSNEIRDIFCEITAKATPYGSGPPDDPERVMMYLVPAGPIHRAAGKLGYQMFGGEQHLAQARAEIARLRSDMGIVLSALRMLEEATNETFDDEGGDVAAIERKCSAPPSAVSSKDEVTP